VKWAERLPIPNPAGEFVDLAHNIDADVDATHILFSKNPHYVADMLLVGSQASGCAMKSSGRFFWTII
jgi:hypothetical protein